MKLFLVTPKGAKVYVLTMAEDAEKARHHASPIFFEEYSIASHPHDYDVIPLTEENANIHINIQVQ